MQTYRIHELDSNGTPRWSYCYRDIGPTFAVARWIERTFVLGTTFSICGNAVTVVSGPVTVQAIINEEHS